MSQNLDLPCILYHLCAIFLDSQDKFWCMNHVYNNELKKCMLFQMLLRDNLMSHLTLRGDKKCFCLNLMAGRNVWYKKIWLANVTPWQKKKLHPIFYLYVTCMAWSGQKMHLPNVTSWHIRWYRSQLTVTHLLCDQCMDDRSQLIMHAN